MMRFLSPIPALSRGLVLHPDGDEDPYVFRIASLSFGRGTSRVVFTRAPGMGTTAVHLDSGLLSFQKRPAAKTPRLWATRTLATAVLTTAAATAARRRRRRPSQGVDT
jgi:hypothetical protein